MKPTNPHGRKLTSLVGFKTEFYSRKINELLQVDALCRLYLGLMVF